MNIKQYVFWGILAAALLGVGSYFGSCGAKTTIEKYNAKLKAAQVQAVQATHWADSVDAASKIEVKRVQDSTKHVNDSLTIVLSRRNENIAKLKSHNDSLLHVLESDTTCTATCQTALDLSRSERKRADSLELQVIDMQTKVDLANTNYAAEQAFGKLQAHRADSLQSVVNGFIKMPTVKDPDKLFGLIKVPSREVVFFVGAATGMVLAHKLKI